MRFQISVYLLSKIFVIGYQNKIFIVRFLNDFIVTHTARLLKHRKHIMAQCVGSSEISIFWSYVTRVIVSMLLGHSLFRLAKINAAGQVWWQMLAGILIFVLVTAIPILGWLIAFIAALLGLGALWL